MMRGPLRVFVGVDRRQPVAWTVLQQSIWARSSVPVSITPIVLPQMPIARRGLTDFTYTRYLVPWLCNYDLDPALFLDADMLCLADIAELFALHDPSLSVQVVKGEHRLEFEWPSLMLFTPVSCRRLTPAWLEDEANMPQSFDWAEEGIGQLPSAWNHCVGYDPPREDAKIVHYTQGVPIFPETRECEYSDEWWRELRVTHATCSWTELMGGSVHAERVLDAHQ